MASYGWRCSHACTNNRMTTALKRLRRPTAGVVLCLALVGGPAVPTVFAQAGKPAVLYYKSWAIVVGIEDYLFASKREGTITDAQAVAEAFRQLGFDEVIEIYDKQAKARQLRYIFTEFLPRKVGRLDRVIFYFAGHSGMTKDRQGKDIGYLVPWDSHIGNVGQSLTLRELKTYSQRIMSKHILMVLDTGVGGWEVTPSQQPSLEGRAAPEDQTEKRALQLLTAAKDGEALIRQNGQGLFVRALLAGLEGKSDTDHNGWILASELAAYVMKGVGEASGGTQHPQFARLRGDGDMILRERPKSAEGSAPKTDPERQALAQALYNRALADLTNQQPVEEALDLLNTALEYDPTHGDAYILKAFILFNLLPNLEGALVAAAQAVKFAPEKLDSHHILGLVLQRTSQYAQAERAFLQALEVDPSNAEIYLTLGDLYAQDLKDQPKSVEAYEQYLKLGGTVNRARDYVQQARKGKGEATP